ncbi:hypothetical protein ACI2TD_03740 [Ralstonia nicotianae]
MQSSTIDSMQMISMAFIRSIFIVVVSTLTILAGCARTSPETDFWKWFQKNEAALFDFERDQEGVFDRLAVEMHKVHPGLTFEFGPKQDGRREFVISADGIREAFPKVESLASAAPALPRWTVIRFRPRREPADIQYNGMTVKASTVSVSIHPDGAKVGLTVLIPGYSASERRAFGSIAFLFLDQALGEFDVETRVGDVDVRAPLPADSNAVPLSELPRTFDTVVSKQTAL